MRNFPKPFARLYKVNYALALSGTGAGNYTLAATTVQGAGTISRRELTLGTVAAQTKTYDGTTAADAGKFSAGLNNTVAGDSVTATAAGATYNSKDVAGANTVNYTGVALGGADAGNYSLDAVAAGTGTITRRALTFDAVAAQTKIYDGNTNADAAQFSATLGNIVAGEENSVSATAAGATYNDKNVAGANKVSYTGLALTGTGAGNYSIANTAEGAGSITKRALTVGTVTAQTKTYDGATAADASQFHATLNNVVAGEESSVAATATGAAYNDKNVAAASTIGYTGVALSGADAGNYSLAATTAQGAGTITRRALTLGAVESQSKTYDGTRAADASKFRAALNNTIAGDNVTAAATGASYNDKNVAAANRIDYTGVALAGADAGNYSLAATTAQGTGTIAKRMLTVGAVTAQTKTYDGTTAADASQFHTTLNNVVAGEENLVLATAAGASYNDKNVARANAVGYTGVALAGAGAGNYTIATTAEGAGTITKRALTLGAVESQSKTYDGNTAADTSKFRATLGNAVAGDNVTAAATTATYNDKNVAAANRIDYTGVGLAGADAGNYTLAATAAQGAGSITKRTLTASAVAAQTKTYDGTTAADASQFHATLNNVVAGEENLVAATAAGAAYNDKNVAGANRIDYTGVALTGTGAGNYSLAATAEGAGKITPKELNLALTSGARFDKTYDGNNRVDQSLTKGTNYTLTGFVGTEGDHLALAAATGTYTAGKDAGTDKEVTFKNLTLAGTGAGNYTLDKTALTGIGTITRRALTLGSVAAQSKTYDGTTAADAAKFSAALTNAIAGDSVTATATGAAYNDKNVAAANRVDYTGVALTGADAGNYSLAATTAQGAGTITRRALTLGAVAAQTKIYDGTTSADAAQFQATLGNFVAGEEGSATVTAIRAAYNDKNVAAATTVNYTGLALKGTGAGNYSIVSTAQGAGTISRRALTLGEVASQTKTYDGTTAADAAQFHATLNNAVAGDSVTATAAGAAYNDKNVAAANAVNYTGLSLTGTSAANYSIVSTAKGVGSITHRDLTLTADARSIVQGEALPSFTGRADGFADGEDASVFGADGITFGTTVTNTDTPGSYGVTGRIGGVSDGVFGNYRIRQAAGNATAFTVNAAALPGGILAALVQDAAPRFDFGFEDSVYLFGMPRPIRAMTLGFYRFDAERDLEIQGLRL